MENILAEAEDLAANGIKEIILVAQDVTRYGIDLYGEYRLPELLEKLCGIDGIEWIRLHYLYPELVTDRLIETIKNHKKILRYLDIPIQHINDNILKRMNRRSTSGQIRELFSKLRRELDGVRLRTSIIAGLPGEGEDEFEELCNFLREAKIERAGFFAFSPEEGTPAAAMSDIPDEDTVARRLEILYGIQEQIMDEYNQSCIGKVFDVLCEGGDAVIQRCYGRTYADAPDIDGKVFFTPKDGIKAGDIVEVIMEDALEGDLIGRAL